MSCLLSEPYHDTTESVTWCGFAPVLPTAQRVVMQLRHTCICTLYCIPYPSTPPCVPTLFVAGVRKHIHRQQQASLQRRVSWFPNCRFDLSEEQQGSDTCLIQFFSQIFFATFSVFLMNIFRAYRGDGAGQHYERDTWPRLTLRAQATASGLDYLTSIEKDCGIVSRTINSKLSSKDSSCLRWYHLEPNRQQQIS